MATKKSKMTTKRKSMVIGNVTYIRESTGECQDFDVIKSIATDFNFKKIWIQNFIKTVDKLGNKKIKFVFFLVDNMNYENVITMTYRQMSRKSGIGLSTVRDTMKDLFDVNFIKRINNGAYRINPNVIFKGGYQKRMNIQNKYDYNEMEDNKSPNEYKKSGVLQTPKQIAPPD